MANKRKRASLFAIYSRYPPDSTELPLDQTSGGVEKIKETKNSQHPQETGAAHIALDYRFLSRLTMPLSHDTVTNVVLGVLSLTVNLFSFVIAFITWIEGRPRRLPRETTTHQCKEGNPPSPRRDYVPARISVDWG